MAYPISDVSRRVVYSGSAGVGPYSFTFEILTQTDIAVYKNSTLLTLTTDYTVTINTNGTGSITLVSAATGADNITIVGDRGIQRTTDFVTGGDLFANTLNQELDALTIYSQQIDEKAERGLKAPVTDPTDIAMTLPAKASRAGKTLAFDANGNPVVGEDIGNWRGNWAAGTSYTVRDLVKDGSNSNVYRCNTAHTSTGSTPISSNTDSAKWDLVVDAAAADASADAAAASEAAAAASASLANDWATKTSSPVAGGEYSAKYHAQAAATSASNASTSATNASNAQTAAEAARDQTLTAFDNFDDRYLGTKSSDPSVDNDGNPLLAGALYFNSTSGIMKVYTGSAWVAAYVSGADYVAKAGDSMTGALAIDVSTSSAALRVTQRGTGNALLVEDSTNPDSTPLVIDQNGVLVVGNQTALVTAYDVQSLTTDGASYVAQRYTTGSGGVFMRMDKSRGATIGTNAVVSSGDTLGTLEFRGDDGASFIQAATIVTAVDGTPGTSDMPGRLVFSTTADGASSVTEAMRINSAQRVIVQKASNGAVTALTDGATITPDFNAANNFSVTLGGNRTLANPTNLTAGQHGVIVITQDGTGSRTLAYGSYFKFPAGAAPTLTTTANAVDVLAYYVESTTRITARLIGDTK